MYQAPIQDARAPQAVPTVGAPVHELSEKSATPIHTLGLDWPHKVKR